MTKSILVVDDDMAIAKLVQAIAETMKYKVLLAFSGKQFLELFSSKPVDVVVIDLIMPEMDGIEILQALAERDAHVSIILMSGYEGKYIPIAEELSSAKGLDIIGTLQKPFSKAELVGLLQQA